MDERSSVPREECWTKIKIDIKKAIYWRTSPCVALLQPVRQLMSAGLDTQTCDGNRCINKEVGLK
jgi:hypothetical protein